MAEISKTIIAVLIVATILVSVIGTWTLLNTVDKAIAKTVSKPVGYGHVSVVVENPQSRTATGKANVRLTVLPRPI